VAQPRLGIAVGQAERDQQWLAQLIGPVNRVLQGVIELAALGLLHPIQDIAPMGGFGQVIEQLHPLGLDTRVHVVGSIAHGPIFADRTIRGAGLTCAPVRRKRGGIPWGEWDAATCSTTVGGVGCCNARIECSAANEHTHCGATLQTIWAALR
jgi:hypothetical protein